MELKNKEIDNAKKQHQLSMELKNKEINNAKKQHQ